MFLGLTVSALKPKAVKFAYDESTAFIEPDGYALEPGRTVKTLMEFKVTVPYAVEADTFTPGTTVPRVGFVGAETVIAALAVVAVMKVAVSAASVLAPVLKPAAHVPE